MTGIELITAERQRQIASEGWTEEHDDKHVYAEIAHAARSYIKFASMQVFWPSIPKRVPFEWPWAEGWWKPSDDPVRNLVKAGALIAAEIDRLQRK